MASFLHSFAKNSRQSTLRYFNQLNAVRHTHKNSRVEVISFANKISFVFLDDFFDLDPEQIQQLDEANKNITLKRWSLRKKLVFYFWFDFFLRNNYSDAGRFVKVVHVDVWLWMRQQILHRTCCKLRTLTLSFSVKQTFDDSIVWLQSSWSWEVIRVFMIWFIMKGWWWLIEDLSRVAKWYSSTPACLVKGSLFACA